MCHQEISQKKYLAENQKKNLHKTKNYYHYKLHKKKFKEKNRGVNKKIQKRISHYQRIM